MALNITINDINDLCLRESRRDTINAVTAFGGGCCCLGTQSCKTIIQKYFDDRLFTMTITTYSCERDDLIIRLVKLYLLEAQSHMTLLMRMKEFIR